MIDTIVLHATVLNTLQEVIAQFSRPESKVSAHYTIDRDGTIVWHVEEGKRSWHAGQSRMKDGRSSVNDFSIGIELVNLNDGRDPYPAPQIEAMRRLEIPEDIMKKMGWKIPLGGPNSEVKQKIFGLNSAHLYNLDIKITNEKPFTHDQIAQIKADYLAMGGERSNKAYGYVAKKTKTA